jgi:hypothetical protein
MLDCNWIYFQSCTRSWKTPTIESRSPGNYSAGDYRHLQERWSDCTYGNCFRSFPLHSDLRRRPNSRSSPTTHTTSSSFVFAWYHWRAWWRQKQSYFNNDIESGCFESAAILRETISRAHATQVERTCDRIVGL